jgi:hypothetical protein
LVSMIRRERSWCVTWCASVGVSMLTCTPAEHCLRHFLINACRMWFAPPDKGQALPRRDLALSRSQVQSMRSRSHLLRLRPCCRLSRLALAVSVYSLLSLSLSLSLSLPPSHTHTHTLSLSLSLALSRSIARALARESERERARERERAFSQTKRESFSLLFIIKPARDHTCTCSGRIDRK